MECFSNEDSPQTTDKNRCTRSFSVEESSNNNIETKLKKTFSTRKALQEKLKAFEEKMRKNQLKF